MRSQFAYLLASRGLGSLFQALLMIWLARTAGVEDFGSVNILLSASAFGCVIADLGISTFMSRERALGKDDVVASCLRLNAVSSTVAALVLGVLGSVIIVVSDAAIALVLLPIAAAVEKNTDTSLSVPIADGDKLTPAVSVVLRRLVALLGFAILVWIHVDSIVAFAIGSLVAAIAGQIHIRIHLRTRIEVGAPRRGDLGVLGRSLPFLVSSVSAQSRLLDTPLVGAVGGAFTAGIYSAASRLIGPLLLIPSTITSLILPHAARRERGTMWSLTLKLTAAFSTALIPLLLVAWVGQWVLPWLLGAAFAPSVPVFQVMMMSVAFIALSSPLGSILQAHHHEKFVSVNGLTFAAVTVAGILLGATFGGAMGAAVGVGASYFAKCAVLFIFMRRVFRSE